jgi:uncharacterized protein (DUF1330 family)
VSVAAYVVVEVLEVMDERTYAQYRAAVDANVAASGGQYLVRGGPVQLLEGVWAPKRLVMVRFDSSEAARDWWSGPGYHDLKAMRQSSTRINMIIVEGLRDGDAT